MATQLPVRIEFRLPDGWQAAPPDEVGAPGAAFVALHRGSVDHGFTANITVAGQIREPNLSLDAIGDESVRRLTDAMDSVSLRERAHAGSAAAPAMTQLLDVTTTANERTLRLVQNQVYLSVRDVDEPAVHAVLEFTLTCTPAQVATVVDDFRTFVAGIQTSR
ncbi:hypothetical protein [Actinophytocola algeriensis]|uniref:DUF1795 domain-containing protein n=1 Tax=Actinophytocola algeriensis TaxID=1768010 RepID=A0A7W7VG59_9PSEU|nr:hypothetical protein [Actinophytocola algeriensis]MBB4908804.1 hypothetical protein [Actinophytocola algeriensis]MBE1474809.1 hypothetical protein [Actinophytocola algeriensis]